MINMTVIHVKTLKKYIIGIMAVIIITAIFFLIGKMRTVKENEENTSRFLGEKPSFLSCLDQTIPAIYQINHEEENQEFVFTKESMQEKILLKEYRMMASIQTIPTEETIQKQEEKNNVNEENEQEEKAEEEKKIEEVRTDLITEEQESVVKNTYNVEYRGIKIKNESKYELTEEMVTAVEEYNMKDILILHTHTCESYTTSEAFSYTHNGNFRTTDLGFSVARVGEEFKKNLEQYGINVIHDTTYHDYPNYSGSYGRSLNTVDSILQKNSDIDIVFDLHRDAISDMSYAPKVKIGEEMASQIMFVIGTDGGGLQHPDWIKNLQFASKVQEKANEIYPGLMKPILVRNSRYNQNLAKGATIIEIGATGNTMEECLVSMKYFAKILSMI